MTKIEWTSETWNPIIGCSKVSPGCANCYAARTATRFASTTPYAEVLQPNPDPYHYGWLPEWNGCIRLISDRLDQPRRWRKPRLIFVNSMSDTFHENVPFEFIEQIFDMMYVCPRHTFQVLTKRPKRMAEYYRTVEMRRPIRRDYPNVWCGTSCEDQKRADERIPHLLKTPAAVRFVSLEPLLGEINISNYLTPYWHLDYAYRLAIKCGMFNEEQVASLRQPILDWVIVGCEFIQGKLGRECKLEWVRSIIEQCKGAGIPVFVKQLPIKGEVSHNIKDWPDWARVRQMPGGGDEAY